MSANIVHSPYGRADENGQPQKPVDQKPAEAGFIETRKENFGQHKEGEHKKGGNHLPPRSASAPIKNQQKRAHDELEAFIFPNILRKCAKKL